MGRGPQGLEEGKYCIYFEKRLRGQSRELQVGQTENHEASPLGTHFWEHEGNSQHGFSKDKSC